MLVDELKKANIQAMKDKDAVARSFYSVILNKIMLEGIKKREKGEEVQDADVSNILQKTIKELEEEKENYAKVGNTSEVENIKTQIEIAKKYLPKMLSRDEIKEIIMSLDDKSVPSVMKYFKMNYNGQCDMREVGEVLKSL
jgi:hypothetical protein